MVCTVAAGCKSMWGTWLCHLPLGPSCHSPHHTRSGRGLSHHMFSFDFVDFFIFVFYDRCDSQPHSRSVLCARTHTRAHTHTHIQTQRPPHSDTCTHKQSNKQERQIKNTLNADGGEEQLLLLNQVFLKYCSHFWAST